MEKEKTFKLIDQWGFNDPSGYSNYDYVVEDFISWLYEKGYTIETRFQGEDLKKQEELINGKN